MAQYLISPLASEHAEAATPQDVDSGLTTYNTTEEDREYEIRATDRIGTRLLKRGLIDAPTLARALSAQAEERDGRRRRLGEILVAQCGVSQDEVAREVARMYGFIEVNLSPDGLADEFVEFTRAMVAGQPEEILEELREVRVVPVRDPRRGRGMVLLVSPEPADRRMSKVARKLGISRFEVGFALEHDVISLLSRVARDDNKFLRDLSSRELEPDELFEDEREAEESLELEAHKSLLTNLIEGCLVEAVRRGASDIHLLPSGKDGVQIRFRQDGKLQLWHQQDGVSPEALNAIVKDRTRNVDRFEREAAQDGFIQRRIDGHQIRFRVSILPIVASEYRRRFESVVIRVLDDRRLITDLEGIGFLAQARKDFVRAISKPQGMVVLTGPTGSGKSTTLVAALAQVLRPELNAITVEDPVEYIIPGARQIRLGGKLDFDSALRSILRHDPDIVMVGEMRDRKTAELAIKLANTGHLTFSTLHTNDAPSAVSRLYKLGIEPFLIAYAINVIVAQRLVRTLCEECKRPHQGLNPEVPTSLGFTREEADEVVFYEAVGCDRCDRGYRGRAAIHEALLFNKEIRRSILDCSGDIDEEAIREIGVRDGMLSLRASGLERIREGRTTCAEVMFGTAED